MTQSTLFMIYLFHVFQPPTQGAVTLSPSAISTCLQNLIVLRCTISGTLLTWTVAVPGNTAQMLSLSSTQILAVQTIRVNNDVFLIERISSDPFEVHMSVNASSALNGTLINCDDSSNNVEDTEMTTISIAGPPLPLRGLTRMEQF